MDISDEIEGLRADRDDIRAAIEQKGGTLPPGSPMADYPAAIEALPSLPEPVNVRYQSTQGDYLSSRAFLSIAKAATNLDGFNLDTSGVTTFTSMFSGCSSLTSTPALDTSKGRDFSNMFQNCTSLTSVPQMDTSQGTSFMSMFQGCSSLVSVPQMDTSRNTSFGNMFEGCSSLTTVPALDMSNSDTPGGMFDGCSSLTQIGVYDFRWSIDISGCKLNATALNAFFTQAGTALNSYQSITITGNPGASACNKTIATNKGWTVYG